MTFNAIAPEPPLVLSPWLYGTSNVAFYANQNSTQVWPNVYVKNMINETGMGAKCNNDDPSRYHAMGIP